MRVLGRLLLNDRDPPLESIDNAQKRSLRFAEVLRLLFSCSPRCSELPVRRCDLAAKRRDLCAGTVSIRNVVLDRGISGSIAGSEGFLLVAVIFRRVFTPFCESVERLNPAAALAAAFAVTFCVQILQHTDHASWPWVPRATPLHHDWVSLKTAMASQNQNSAPILVSSSQNGHTNGTSVCKSSHKPKLYNSTKTLKPVHSIQPTKVQGTPTTSTSSKSTHCIL